jgi:hypothetical protein
MGSADITAPYGYLVGAMIFFGFIGFISALAGPSMIDQAPEPPKFDMAQYGLVTIPIFAINNLLYFFQLMTVSTPFAIFGVMIIAPFSIVVGLLALQLAIGLVP